jgi:hypothetical protein
VELREREGHARGRFKSERLGTVRSYMYSGDHITGHRDAPDLTFDIWE